MTGTAFQIVISIWLGVHPVTYTLPKIYYWGSASCELAGIALVKHAKHRNGARHVEVECIPTDKREL